MINKVTPRSRNSETDSRFVKPDQYTDALNIRVENSNDEQGTSIPSSNFGVVKPVKGTVSIDESGLVVVGKIVDERGGVAYVAAIHADANKNGVYSVSGDSVSQVVTSTLFNWNQESRVDMSITYKSNHEDSQTGAVIYMTDNVNEPMKVDVDYHLNNNPVGLQLWHAITVCTPTPQEIIETSFGYNEGVAQYSSVSNFRNIPGMQFAYQNIHETGEVSPLSAYSPLAVPPAYLQQGANEQDDVDNYNSLQITIPAQPNSVEKVRLLVRFGEEGAWYIISEEDSTGSSMDVFFSNDEILSILPEQQTKRAFENVPQVAKTNDVVEDRLFYGNYVEGYDNTPVTAAMTVDYKDRPDDFLELDINVQSQVAQVDNQNFSSSQVQNRVAGLKLSLENPEGIDIPAGSTVSFDISFAPDKNLHLYESARSFHANNELYDYNTQEGNFNPDLTSQTFTGATYGVGSDNTAPVSVGDFASGVRVGISDDIVSGESAKWQVAAGPFQDQEIDVVYGTSPANPLIFRGGEISFSVKYRALVDLEPSEVMTLIKQVLSGSTTPMIIGSSVKGELISSSNVSTYSYNLGLQNREVIKRNSSITDLICHVASREEVISSDGFTNEPIPLGFFVVNEATLDFKLRDLTDLEGVSLSDTEAFFALDIAKIQDYKLRTCVPVYKTSDVDFGEAAPFAAAGDPDSYVPTSGQFIEGPFVYDEYRTIQKWIAFEPTQVGGSMSLPTALELFSNLDGSSSGYTYKSLLDNDTEVDLSVFEALDGNSEASRFKWFGRLKTANTSLSEVGAEIGGGAGGGATTTTPGDLMVPFEVAASRIDELILQVGLNQTVTSLTDYNNYAFSMLDGEGGIGGWKGSLPETAIVYAEYVSDPTVNTEWVEVTQNPFTEADIRAAMGGFGGKIEGSVPSCIALHGFINTSARVVHDDRDENTFVSESGKYPDGVNIPQYGPTLLGFHFPFQYLNTGFVSLNGGTNTDSVRYLGEQTVEYSEMDTEVLETYSLITEGELRTPIPGYLRINADGTDDEQPSALEVLSNNTFILSAQDDAQGFKSFKRYSDHDFGVVYYDQFGRSGGVNPLPSVYVAGYAESEGGAASVGRGGIGIGCQITSPPPNWAFKYRFVYGGNSTTSDFIQFMAGGAFVPADDDPDNENSGNIYVSLNYLQGNPDVSYANAFGAVSDIGDKNLYKYGPGDKLRVISYFVNDSLDQRVYPVNYVFDVVDVVTLTDGADNPLHGDADGDVPRYKTGQFVVIKSNPGASGFTYPAVRNADGAASTSEHLWNNRTFVEIFSPRAKREEQELVYREIGKSYDVLIDSTGNLVHENSTHYIYDGDVWFRRSAMNVAKWNANDGEFKNIIKASNASTPRFLNYYVESNRFTDMFPGTKVIGRGKAKVFMPNARRVRRRSSITFSDANNPAAIYNKFSTFDNTTANFKNIPNEHGEIDKIHRDGESLTVFQNRKTSYLPINRSVISDASDNASLIASAKVVGTQVFVPGSYGTGGNQEAVLYVDGFYYYANKDRREVYRYRPGSGVEVISNSGMKDYFNYLFKNNQGSSARIVTGFDYLNDEFVIDVTNYVPVNYTTDPVLIVQGSGQGGGTENGADAFVYQDPTTVIGDPDALAAAVSTASGLQSQVDELEGIVNQLQEALEVAYNDVTSVIVDVNVDVEVVQPGDGGDPVAPTDVEEGVTLPSPIEVTQEYVVASNLLIESQQILHQTVLERANLALGMDESFINEAYFSSAGSGFSVWDKTGLEPPSEEEIQSIAESITGIPGYNTVYQYSVTRNSLQQSSGFYRSDSVTYNYPFANADGTVSTENSGFTVTYVVGYGVGLTPQQVSDIAAGVASGQSGVDPATTVIDSFFPTPEEASYISVLNDPTLSGITNQIASFIDARNVAIQVMNTYLQQETLVVTGDFASVQAERDEAVAAEAAITQLYIKDIQAMSAIINNIAKPGLDGQGDPISWNVIGSASGAFVIGAADNDPFDIRDQLGAFGFEDIDVDEVSNLFSNQLQDNYVADFTDISSENTTLRDQRDALASQVYELVQGVGQGFAGQIEEATGEPAEVVFQDPTLNSIYNIDGDPVTNVLGILGSADGVIDANSVVSASEVELTTVDVIDSVTNVIADEAVANKIESDGLDASIQNLISAVTEIIEETSGSVGSAGEADAALESLNALDVTGINSVIVDGTLASQLDALTTMINSSADIRGNRTSVKTKIFILRDVVKEIENILIGSVNRYTPTSLSPVYPRADIQSTISNTTQDTGFLSSSGYLNPFVGSLLVTNPDVSLAEGAVRGNDGSVLGAEFFSNLVGDVQYVVNQLTDFQKLLGSHLEGPYESVDGSLSFSNSDARLGISGVNSSDIIGFVNDPSSRVMSSGGTEFSTLFSLKLFLDSLLSRLDPNVIDHGNSLVSTIAGTNGTGYVSSVFIGEGEYSSLFGDYGQQQIASEAAEGFFGSFTTQSAS